MRISDWSSDVCSSDLGIGLGQLLPKVFIAIASAEVAHVNLIVAALIWLMIIPMLLKIDFASLGSVRQHWKGVGGTFFINWAIQPFSMAPLGPLFIGQDRESVGAGMRCTGS